MYYDVIETQPALRVRRPNRVTGCVQAANNPSCTAHRIFGRARIGQDRYCRVDATRPQKKRSPYVWKFTNVLKLTWISTISNKQHS